MNFSHLTDQETDALNLFEMAFHDFDAMQNESAESKEEKALPPSFGRISSMNDEEQLIWVLMSRLAECSMLVAVVRGEYQKNRIIASSFLDQFKTLLASTQMIAYRLITLFEEAEQLEKKKEGKDSKTEEV